MPRQAKTCSVDGCDKKHYGKGYCHRHYKRARYPTLKRNANKEKDWQLRNRYDMSLEQYESMLTEQEGTCAICGKPPSEKALAVDHCHETGQVRGLLCRNCNLGLGFLRDSKDLLENAIKYLQEH